MLLFAGLGNPGEKYRKNRHNIGFTAVEKIAEEHGFTPWKTKFKGEVSEGRFGSQKVLLLKPNTFMNLSGQSVGEAMQFYKIALEDVTIFHDELDLAPGKIRVKQGGGHAGHNGLRSLHKRIGEGYQRVRIGIGHPGQKELVAHYVLHDFAKADAEWLDDLLRGISDGAEHLANGANDQFQNAVALRMQSPKTNRKAPEKTPEKPKERATEKLNEAVAQVVLDETKEPEAHVAASKDSNVDAPKERKGSFPFGPGGKQGQKKTPLQRLVNKFR